MRRIPGNVDEHLYQYEICKVEQEKLGFRIFHAAKINWIK